MINLNQFRAVILNLGFATLLVGTDFFLYNHPSVPTSYAFTYCTRTFFGVVKYFNIQFYDGHFKKIRNH